MKNEIGQKVKGYIIYNERWIMLKIATTSKDTVIICSCMPTTDHKEEEAENGYEGIQEPIKYVKREENIIMWDWNIIIVYQAEEKVTGSFGLGKRNERRTALDKEQTDNS